MNNNFNNDSGYNSRRPFRIARIIVAISFVIASVVIGIFLPNSKDSTKASFFNLFTSKEFNHPVTLIGEENVKIDANASFKVITDEKELGDFYNYEEIDYSTILLAAENSNTRLTVEENDGKEYLDYLNSEIEELKKIAPEAKEEKIEELKENGYNDVEIEFMERVIDGETLTEEEMKYLSQEFISQEFLYSYYSHNSEFSYIGKEDYQVNGWKVQVSEFIYPDENGDNLRFYEAGAVKGEDIYILTIWAYEEDFVQNKNDYQRYIRSFEY